MALNIVFTKSPTQSRLLLAIAASALLLLAGCASTPSHLKAPAADAPGIKQVRADAEANLNKSVRWGGTVVGIQNLDGETRVEVIAKPLFRGGQPDSRQVSQGRFIAVFDEFLDPSDYKKDSALTVVGVVTGTELGKVGEAEYDFPRVQATAHQLWPAYNSNTRFAQRSEYGYGAGYYGSRGYGYRRGYGRYGRGFGRGHGFGGRYNRHSAFYNWWVPGVLWSVYGNHHGYHRGSRLRLNVQVGN